MDALPLANDYIKFCSRLHEICKFHILTSKVLRWQAFSLNYVKLKKLSAPGHDINVINLKTSVKSLFAEKSDQGKKFCPALLCDGLWSLFLRIRSFTTVPV
jgi:hypothetical protein